MAGLGCYNQTPDLFSLFNWERFTGKLCVVTKPVPASGLLTSRISWYMCEFRSFYLTEHELSGKNAPERCWTASSDFQWRENKAQAAAS